MLGLISTILVSIIYLSNNKNKMLVLNLVASVLSLVHYSMLGANTAALLNIAVIIRCIVYLIWNKTKITVTIFIIFFVLIGIITYKNWYSPLSSLGSIASSIAFWEKETKNVRKYALVSSWLWFIYGIFTQTLGGISTGILCTITILIGKKRFDN